MKTLLKVLGSITALAACFGFGYAFREVRRGETPSKETMMRLVSSEVRTNSLTPTQIYKQTYNRILSSYYRPIDPAQLSYAGLSGLMAALGDPHTQFLEPKVAAEFSLETRGNFVGVGARLQPDPLGARVRKIFKEGPAARAGVKDGDLIIGVDGTRVSGMDTDDIVQMIRGKEGTFVELKILRGDESKPISIKIRRAKIITPTAEGVVLDGTDIGYLTVSQFVEPTAAQFDEALNDLTAEKIKGLVIDMRGNPGGLLDTAADMLSRFVDDKVVVKMRFRDGNQQVVKTYTGQKREFNYPVVVLVNEDSASAAEIFAGVVRDYKLGTLVGDHTYGKSSVQHVFPLPGGASAKITIAKYFLPLGDDIGRKVDDDGMYLSGGLQPDVKAGLGLDPSIIPGDPKSDTQLQKAIEIIREKRNLPKSQTKVGSILGFDC